MKNIYDVLHSLGPLEVNITENLINLLPGNVFVVNEQGYLLWGNQRILDTLHLKSLDEYIGKHIGYWDSYSWECCQAIIESGKELIAEESYQGRYYMTNRKPLFSINGKIVAILGTALDITEQKQAQIAKQEFLMNMAHDLRTPLTGIIGLSSIQVQDGTDIQDRQYGHWIFNAAEQLLELLNAVMLVTAAEHKSENLAKDIIDLHQLADELEALMKPAVIDKKLEFELKLTNHLPKVITDRLKLKRIVLNLLSNAVKFTKQGKIKLEIKLLGIEQNQAKIKILISDTGVGIPEDKLDKIFDRFYRAHPSYQTEYKGYGMGLFLVKKAVKLLNGEINVSSKEGKGSCFAVTFIFPLAKEQSEVIPLISKHALSKPNANEPTQSVLVAEDNTLALHVVEKLLSNFGYKITIATNGKTALKALKTQCFHWALLDIGLPDLNGTEIVKRYRQWEQKNKKSHLPIFSLTAHLEKNVVDKCKRVGFDCVLNKPLTEKDLQIIQNFLNE